MNKKICTCAHKWNIVYVSRFSMNLIMGSHYATVTQFVCEHMLQISMTMVVRSTLSLLLTSDVHNNISNMETIFYRIIDRKTSVRRQIIQKKQEHISIHCYGFCSNRDATLTKINHHMCSSFAIVLSGKENSFLGDAHPTAAGILSS